MIHALAAVLLPSLPLADLFVDASAASCTSGDGSASAPVCSIADAVGLAVAGDTIRIAPGTYVENVSILFDLDLVGTSGESVTVVDGGASGSVITIPQSVTVSIDGLTITNGRANHGAGILCDGSLLLSNSTVHGNSTPSQGNMQRGGAGIGSSGYGVTADLQIDNCVIRDNEVSSDGNAAGGGIFLGGGSLTLTNSTIRGNRAAGEVLGQGAGVFVFGNPTFGVSADVTMSSTTISNNEATSGLVFSYAGGIFVGYGSFDCEASTISGNTAQVGGGMEIGGALTSIRNTTLSGNSATLIGGGIHVAVVGAGSEISHSTVTQNSSPQGAGLGSSTGNLTVLGVRNTIVAQNFNTSPHGAGEVGGDFLSLGHNLIGTGGNDFTDGVIGDQVGSELAPLDPRLAPLRDNGGPTDTHALLPGSPAIDKASNATFDPLDQRGIARPQGLRPDIGALEREGNTSSLCNGDGGDGLGCTDCPCGNNAMPGTIGGCRNSVGRSARLEAIGSTSVSLPPGITSDLRLSLVGAPPLTFGILFSSNTTAPPDPLNPCFGSGGGVMTPLSNGLNCIAGPIVVHGIRRAHTNGTIGLSTLPWGGEAAPQQGLAQSPTLFPAGQTRYYQVIYRDEAFGTCGRRLNSSQAVEIVLTP